MDRSRNLGRGLYPVSKEEAQSEGRRVGLCTRRGCGSLQSMGAGLIYNGR